MLSVTTGARADLWRETHHGLVHDDGHLRYATVSGDFTAEATVSGDYRERIDERHWLKAGIEYVRGRRTAQRRGDARVLGLVDRAGV